MQTRISLTILVGQELTKEQIMALLQDYVNATPYAIGAMLQEFVCSQEPDPEQEREEYEIATGNCYDCRQPAKQCTCPVD